MSEAKLTSTSTVTVLLVDDDQTEHLLFERKLAGFSNPAIALGCVEDIDAAVRFLENERVDMILLDNRLTPRVDFRETAPKLRDAGFTGPIGLISTDISGDYFQSFPDFGVDFRIGKDEIDAQAITFIMAEYLGKRFENSCDDDPR